MQIVGLRFQTVRTSAFSVEKVCHYPLTSAHKILKPRAAIHKVVECLANNEFFVHLHRKVLEAQRVHQILRLNWKQASMKRRF